jgi:hypothetical protein
VLVVFGEAMIRVILGLLAAVLVTVVPAKLVFEATSDSGAEPANQPWAQNAMEFVAWNGEKWTAWIRDDDFELRPQKERPWQGHSNVSLAFVDWEGTPWQAKVDGNAFLLAHRGDWKSHTQRVAAIRYRDWTGNNQLRTPVQLRR